MADRTESIVLDFEVDFDTSVESIDNLTKANKRLREERKKLDTATAEGKKEIERINAQIDVNTNKIKANVSALEKQKINIGNYSSALDRVIPGLSGFIEKGASATKTVTGLSTATKLLLGPIGLLILAGTAIVKFLTGSEEGMDKLAVVMAKVSAVVGVVTDRLIQLGGSLVKFLSGDFSGGIDGIKNSFSGMGDEMEREIGLAVDLAERLDILDDLNLSLKIRLSEQENVIKNLIIQSRNRFLSEEQRMKLLVQAATLEKQLTGERLALRLAEINAIASGIQMRNSEKQAAQQAGETTIEFAKRIAGDNRILLSDREKIAEQLDQYNGLLDNQANIQEKIQTQQDAISDKIAENLREQEALRRANERAQNPLDSSTTDPLIGAFETRARVITDLDKRLQDELIARNKATQDRIIADKKRAVELEKDLEFQKLDAAQAVAGGIAGILDEQGEAYKLAASAQVIISTYASAQKAYEAAFLPIPTVASPGLGVAFAAAAVLKGLANLAAINGVEFAEGGYTGDGNKWDVAGLVHKGEYVTPKRVVNSPAARPHINALEAMRLKPYADGGLVANSIVRPINQNMEIMNFMKHMPRPVVEVVEIRKGIKTVDVKERLSKR